jgi:hypothetical protein
MPHAVAKLEPAGPGALRYQPFGYYQSAPFAFPSVDANAYYAAMAAHGYDPTGQAL